MYDSLVTAYLDADEDLGEGQAGHPVARLDAVDADVSVAVHVGMEDLGQESDLRGPEGVEHGHLDQME